jgi:hypothetical protein
LLEIICVASKHALRYRYHYSDSYFSFMQKDQFNARIPGTLRRAVVTTAAALGMTNEQMAELAFSVLLGTDDEVKQAQKRKVERVVRDLRLSFDTHG